jgi:hypothetical protein
MGFHINFMPHHADGFYITNNLRPRVGSASELQAFLNEHEKIPDNHRNPLKYAVSMTNLALSSWFNGGLITSNNDEIDFIPYTRLVLGESITAKLDYVPLLETTIKRALDMGMNVNLEKISNNQNASILKPNWGSHLGFDVRNFFVGPDPRQNKLVRPSLLRKDNVKITEDQGLGLLICKVFKQNQKLALIEAGIENPKMKISARGFMLAALVDEMTRPAVIQESFNFE